MSIAHYAGTGYIKVNITLYQNTGFTVDRLPASQAAVETETALVINKEARLYTRYGIGVLRIASIPYLMDDVDYCKITGEYELVRGLDTYGSDANPVYGEFPDYKSSYYFVTGNNPLNGGVTEVYVMLDCWTTVGATLASFGGMVTRRPLYDLDYNDTATEGNYREVEPNTIAEPFTQSFPTKRVYSVLKAAQFQDEGSSTAPRKITIVLSPYELINGTAANLQRVVRTVTQDDGTTVATETPAKGTAAQTETVFYLSGKTGAPSGTYGTLAYQKWSGIEEDIAEYYAAGITNPVFDAYSCEVSDVTYREGQGGAISAIKGIDGSIQELFTKADGDTSGFNLFQKWTWYGCYVTLISFSSGQSQTVPLYECMLATESDPDNLGFYIDVASDPTPNGALYARIRRNNEQKVDTYPMAMAPGGVASSNWKRAFIRTELNGNGVEAGQAWRNAELDIDAYSQALNAAATNAQYDLTAGNGYLLKNVGNEYGLYQLSARNNAATAQRNAQHNQNIASMVSSGAGKVASGMTAGALAGSVLPGAGNVAGAVIGAGAGIVGATADIISANISDASQQSTYEIGQLQNDISQRQLEDQGQYNTQLLRAQSAAATQMSNASLEKTRLMQTRLANFPQMSILSSDKRGILTGTEDIFLVVFSYMDPRDVTRLQQTINEFGFSCYDVPPAKPRTDQPWNFYKMNIPGNAMEKDWGFPAWVVKGAIDQISGGVWFKGTGD